jgi:hypothetical protein
MPNRRVPMLGFLIPREFGFFDQFDKMASCAVEGAGIFVDMIEHYGDAPAKIQRLREVEHRADEITHHTIEMLHKTFVTPMDRDQIHRLITRMDDVLDLLDCAARRMTLYDVKEPTSELRELAKVLYHSTLEIQKAVGYLRNLKNADAIKRSCIEINKLENDGDALRDSVVAKLFKDQTDAIGILKWKEIYEDVETAIDRCEDVANVIEGVVLENA